MGLAPYAITGDFSRAVSKIIYSNPYRRMAHKSQVIVKPSRDHFRSRLIHTGEVNQIALTIGKELELNLELISAMGYAHDLGHTPFGHAGERGLQTILERELAVRFGIRPARGKEKAQRFRREIFHHSSNSVRILLKEQEFENASISDEILRGVSTHSWSPWKEDTVHAVPTTYEAQVVAIADQIASINHDTEDIIEGAPYTEYDRDEFSKGLATRFKKKSPKSYARIQSTSLYLITDKSMEAGYGRERRIETIVKDIVDHTKRSFDKHGVSQSAQATQYPISPSEDWCHYLRCYEQFIRNLIQEKVSWFIGRDNMSAALIAIVFNHLWPRARTAGAISEIRAPLFEKEEMVKIRVEERTRYLDHFIEFYKEHYGDGEQYKSAFLDRVSSCAVPVWDYSIMRRFKKKPVGHKLELFARLVAAIDFIAGLTDRYCLEIFDDVYEGFIAT